VSDEGHWVKARGMEREGAQCAAHRRRMETLERGARAREHSRLLLALHEDLDAQLRASVAVARARRAELRAERERLRRSQSDT